MPRQTREAALLEGWRVDTVPHLAGGQNSTNRPDLIADEQAVEVLNLSIRDQRVRRESGYEEIGANSYLLGTPKGGVTRRFDAGTPVFILVTDTSLFKYVPGAQYRQTDQFQLLPWGDNESGRINNGTTLTTGTTAAGSAVLTVAAGDEDTGNTSDPISVEMDNGLFFTSTIASKASGSITMDDAIPTGRSVAIGAAVNVGYPLSGGDTDQVVIVNVPGKNWTVVVNGVDFPLKYDGTDVRKIPGLSSVLTGGSDTARTCALYRSGYLMFANLTIAGAFDRTKVIWCDTNNPEEWVLGDAGNAPLTDTDDDIRAMHTLGDDLVIYRGKSIVRVQWIGQEGNLFSFKTLIQGVQIGAQGVGALSHNSVVHIDQGHLVMSNDGIYLLTAGLLGGGQVQDLSNDMFEEVFATNGNMDKERTNKAFAFYSDLTNEATFCYPSLDATNYCDKAVVLDVETGTLRTRTFNKEMTFAGYRPLATGETLRIQDLVGTIAEQDWIIGGQATQAGSPRVLLGSDSDDKVYEDTATVATQAGESPTRRLRTKRYSAAERYLRRDWVEVEYLGENIVVSYYQDDGTPIEIATLPGNDEMMAYRLYPGQYIGRFVQLLFEQTAGGDMEIGKVSFRWREESSWTL